MADALDELLIEATAALRARADGDAPVDATRRRVLASAAPRSRPRRVGVVAFAFALSSGTLAWAAATGRIERALEGLGVKARAVVAPLPEPGAIVGRGDRALPAAASEPAPAPAVAPAVVAAAPAVDVAAPAVDVATPAPAVVTPVAPSRSRRPARIVRAAPPEVAPPAPVVAVAPSPSAPAPHVDVEPPPVATPAVDDAELIAYRRAHALHFHGGAPAATLAAWDAYLAAFPDGRFAVDARYDRALVLVRLGRRAAARAALTPFADGAVDGGYRQREARALRAALEAQP